MIRKIFTEEEVKQAISKSCSYAELARNLGYSDRSGHYVNDVKKWIEKYNCDISHFLGQGWSKGHFNYDRFKNKTSFKGGELLRFLLKGEKRPYKCECCGNTEWNGQQIPLQVHHIDGNHYNNEISNLQLLCPNCHAQTDTFCGRNKSRENITDEEIIEAIKTSYSIAEVLRKIKVCDTWQYRGRVNSLIEETKTNLLKKNSSPKKESIDFRAIQEKEYSKRKEYFLSGKVDFSKRGWQAQAEKDLGISHTQIRRWLKKYMPELDVFSKKQPN